MPQDNVNVKGWDGTVLNDRTSSHLDVVKMSHAFVQNGQGIQINGWIWLHTNHLIMKLFRNTIAIEILKCPVSPLSTERDVCRRTSIMPSSYSGRIRQPSSCTQSNCSSLSQRQSQAVLCPCLPLGVKGRTCKNHHFYLMILINLMILIKAVQVLLWVRMEDGHHEYANTSM